MMTKLNFAREFRPQRFQDVFGQERVVTALSNLIKEGKIERNIVLYGSVGSGKTTSVRIYAKTLNCDQPTAEGEPCETCPSCQNDTDLRRRVIEYDVPGKGGSEKHIRNLVEPYDNDRVVRGVRVFFFDEAHRLEPAAAEFLLKRVEETPQGVVYCFATTDLGKISKALRSRLVKLEVRPLGAEQSIEFLKLMADKIGLEYEPDALSLLAGLQEGFPRDLLNGLEYVYRPDQKLELEYVKRKFQVDYTQLIVDYFMALADGDLPRQTRCMLDWREPTANKIKWIQAFLVSLFYNNILGQLVVTDALIASIRTERAPILARFCSRFGIANLSHLAPAWLKMIAFWSDMHGDVDETRLLLKLTLFHELVCQQVQIMTEQHASTSLFRTARARPHVPTESQTTKATPEGNTHDGSTDEFMNPGVVRTIINSASFMTQEFGTLFNARFDLRPAFFDVNDAREARSLLIAFLDELKAQTNVWCDDGANLYASIALLERDEGGLVHAIVLSHISRPSDQTSDDVESWNAQISQWSDDWRSSQRVVEGALNFGPVSTTESALRWHWNQVLDLCAGLDDEASVWDPETQQQQPLLALLGLPAKKLRQTGPIRGGLIYVSDRLSQESIDRSSEHRMAPLSAFDDQAWSRLCDGWELKEFNDRQKLRQERQKQLTHIANLYSKDPQTVHTERNKVVQSWPTDPHQRPRRWQGWWTRQDT